MKDKKPTILVFAGPNGSGKSTITESFGIIGRYINADEIRKGIPENLNENPDLIAAQIATSLRENCIKNKEDFTFETVLSTSRNIKLLEEAKQQGYFIKSVFVLTKDYRINLNRVDIRVQKDGHPVPADKIKSRYEKSLNNLSKLVDLSDVCHVYDNSNELVRIFKKKHNTGIIYKNDLWSTKSILDLIWSEQTKSILKLEVVDK